VSVLCAHNVFTHQYSWRAVCVRHHAVWRSPPLTGGKSRLAAVSQPCSKCRPATAARLPCTPPPQRFLRPFSLHRGTLVLAAEHQSLREALDTLTASQLQVRRACACASHAVPFCAMQ